MALAFPPRGLAEGAPGKWVVPAHDPAPTAQSRLGALVARAKAADIVTQLSAVGLSEQETPASRSGSP